MPEGFLGGRGNLLTDVVFVLGGLLWTAISACFVYYLTFWA